MLRQVQTATMQNMMLLSLLYLVQWVGEGVSQRGPFRVMQKTKRNKRENTCFVP